MQMRVRYIERSPEKLDMIFKNSKEFWTFYGKRCRSILDLYGNYDMWDREHFKITKKGKPRKYHYPKQLFTKKAKEKQKKSWERYINKVLMKNKLEQMRIIIKKENHQETFVINNQQDKENAIKWVKIKMQEIN